MATNLVTRGLGSSHTLAGRGFGSSVAAVADAIVRYGGRRAKDASKHVLKIAEDVVDIYKITASLISINRHEIIFPTSKTVEGAINRSKDITVSINNFAVSNVYKPTYRIVIDILGVDRGIK